MKTGIRDLLILGIIRTCLGFYILMLELHDATNGISTA